MPIRLRLALAFAAAAALLFAVGGWLFASALSAAQLGAIDSQLTAQLAQAARYLPGNGTGPQPATAATPAPGEYLLQVVDSTGRVRGASPDAGTTPLLTAAELGQARQAQLSATRTIDEEDTRITAAPLAGHPGLVAVAAVSLETYDATQSQVLRELAIGGGIFVAIAGLGAYWLARAALSPVERLRRQVAALSERGDAAGVEVPPTRDEIAALAGTMNDLLTRLRRTIERERAFVDDASHELRSPLAVLRGELELAGRPGRSAGELAAAVRSSAEEAERLDRITDDLLVLARGDAGQLDLRLRETDLRQLLSRSAGHATARLTAAQLTCQIDVPAGTRACIDPDRIRQAIDNLLGNALRFAPAGSVITIAVREDGPDLTIDVRDAGPGFPPDFLPHAFERFRRPDAGRSRDGGGSGLGLAIVAAIAVAHGGTATARNEPGGGAVVSLRLPRRTRLALADGDAEQVPDAVGKGQAERAADDDPQHRAADVAAAQAGAEGTRQAQGDQDGGEGDRDPRRGRGQQDGQQRQQGACGERQRRCGGGLGWAGDVIRIDVQFGVEVGGQGAAGGQLSGDGAGGIRGQALASYRAVSSASSASGVSPTGRRHQHSAPTKPADSGAHGGPLGLDRSEVMLWLLRGGN